MVAPSHEFWAARMDEQERREAVTAVVSIGTAIAESRNPTGEAEYFELSLAAAAAGVGRLAAAVVPPAVPDRQ